MFGEVPPIQSSKAVQDTPSPGRRESDGPWPRSARLGVLLLVACAVATPQILALRTWQDRGPEADRNQQICVQAQRVPENISNHLQDVTGEMRLNFEPTIGPLGTYFMPEIGGTGAALFDYDNDGRLDIYLLNAGRSPQARGDFPIGAVTHSRLFHQLPSGRFEEVTESSGLGKTGYAISCAVGDVDNDGDQDVFVACYGPDQLFRNNADGTFTDITAASGLQSDGWSSSAIFFDFNRDGRLDLFVAKYVDDPLYGHSIACSYGNGRVTYCGPRKFTPVASQLFENIGVAQESGAVQFRDVSRDSGIGQALGAGFGAVTADFNEDGWQDLYVVNDTYPNRLWVNRGDGTFRDEAVGRGLAVGSTGEPQGSMGVAIGDVNGDEHFDVVVTNVTSEPSAMYINDGNGLFVENSERSQIADITLPHTSWGIVMQDLDHDRDLDLAITNGLIADCDLLGPTDVQLAFEVRRDVVTDPNQFWKSYTSANLLLVNDGQGRFINGSSAGGEFCAALRSARGLAYGDIDEDGDLDLLVTYCGAKARLYRNELPKSGHWLKVRAVDPRWRRDAYGARVTVVTGPHRMSRLIQPASSYIASNDVRAHFGLGPPARYDELIVTWPDGVRESFAGGPADRTVLVERGAGRMLEGEQ